MRLASHRSKQLLWRLGNCAPSRIRSHKRVGAGAPHLHVKLRLPTGRALRALFCTRVLVANARLAGRRASEQKARQAMQIPRLVWTMVGNTKCLGNGQIHREGSCDKRTTPMDPCTSQLARYGGYRQMGPSCRLHPMYKLQHAHTRPHGST